jgi:hypothetical protein
MKKKVTKVKVKKVAPTAEYSASIKVVGKVYTASGGSALEAIANLKPEGQPKGISILTISKGGQKRERLLGRPLTFRLFSPSPLMREIALKQVSLISDF